MLSGRKKPLAFQVTFKPKYGTPGGDMEGNGTDDVAGDFSIHGTYSDKAPYPCDCTFSFADSSSMVLTGWRESDKGGIFGQWKGPLGSGSYAFYPSKEGSDTKKKLEEASNKQRQQQLLNMGFPDYLVEEALKQTSGLEPAVNWITSKLDNDDQFAVTEDAVDSESLQQLISMGFDEEMAKQALIKQKGKVEAAANWLFDHM